MKSTSIKIHFSGETYGWDFEIPELYEIKDIDFDNK